jgi:hypothetical protein
MLAQNFVGYHIKGLLEEKKSYMYNTEKAVIFPYQ